jgi:hypothetical protein
MPEGCSVSTYCVSSRCQGAWSTDRDAVGVDGCQNAHDSAAGAPANAAGTSAAVTRRALNGNVTEVVAKFIGTVSVVVKGSAFCYASRYDTSAVRQFPGMPAAAVME